MKNFASSDNSQGGQEEEAREGGSEGEFSLSHSLTLSLSHSLTPPTSPTPSLPLLLNLIPVIGFFPSLWTLYRRRGSREQLAVSRLSITLAMSWLLGYLLLTTGAETSEFLTLRLLILNSFLTSFYFLLSIWLIVRAAKGTKRLPGSLYFAQRLLTKYLS